ncbi:MAG: rRNA maturation RNase YbeY [Muribaculaceae bacterium]|nr:rRNA maturation RNase YbeY [Muribaculaceae bacterium]
MISFNVDGVELPDLNFCRVETWIKAVADSHDFETGRLSYLFCDDEYILGANRQFIDHDYYTDIITFDYTRRNRIAGDIMISLDTVASNAAMLDIPYKRELLRVIIHGVLHLCGINDKGPGEREIMEDAENKALEIWDNISSNC